MQKARICSSLDEANTTPARSMLETAFILAFQKQVKSVNLVLKALDASYVVNILDEFAEVVDYMLSNDG